MEKVTFNIAINAPREKVWEVLWNDSSYREWTSVFSEGSKVETDWQKGGKVLFLDGQGHGMVSTIAEKIPNEYMSFKHLGEVKDGVEDTTSERVKEWAGAMENYTLKGEGGKTELIVDLDIEDAHKAQFEKMFPQALSKVKQLAEQN